MNSSRVTLLLNVALALVAVHVAALMIIVPTVFVCRWFDPDSALGIATRAVGGMSIAIIAYAAAWGVIAIARTPLRAAAIGLALAAGYFAAMRLIEPYALSLFRPILRWLPTEITAGALIASAFVHPGFVLTIALSWLSVDALRRARSDARKPVPAAVDASACVACGGALEREERILVCATCGARTKAA